MKSRVFEIIAAEQARQNSTVELIASENFVSENVMKAVGSVSYTHLTLPTIRLV